MNNALPLFEKSLRLAFLILISILSIPFLLGLFINNSAICSTIHMGLQCSDFLSSYMVWSFLFSIGLFFSSILYFMHIIIFRIWFVFTILYSTIFALILNTLPNHDQGGGWILSTPSTQGYVAIIGALLYIVISFVLILIMFFIVRRSKSNS
jgi:hypothetical protein